jgi:DNA-binding GntR family transcriptional regulator
MVNRDLDVPLYVQLANTLRDMITSGEIPPHHALPSISYLRQEHDVADQTVKKAIAILRGEGLVHTVQGKGTYVTGD